MTLCFTFCLLLTGCNKSDPQIETYKSNMNQFFENIKTFDSAINSIDPESENAVNDLLYILDTMNTNFEQMASLSVPEGFPGVEELADEANDYMKEAVTYYHQAFESEPFDSYLADIAKQNYDRANLRLQYIVSILHGDIPEEIYTYEEEDEDNVTNETQTSDAQ